MKKPITSTELFFNWRMGLVLATSFFIPMAVGDYLFAIVFGILMGTVGFHWVNWHHQRS